MKIVDAYVKFVGGGIEGVGFASRHVGLVV
jgi:hypothetical protein